MTWPDDPYTIKRERSNIFQKVTAYLAAFAVLVLLAIIIDRTIDFAGELLTLIFS
jgi:hypothetical protein